MRDCGKRFPVPTRNAVKAWKKAEAELNRIEVYNKEFTSMGYERNAEVRKLLAARRR